ncbi:MAG: ubiquinone biosynthesis protein UbiB, partial [Rhizobiales bacterium]|nr:ubiquinone biosynthesis protein UbiB [Hyphomicrobiales bacterium]
MSTLGASLRLARAGWVLARKGVLASLPGDELSGAPKAAWRVSKALAGRRAARKGRTERLADAVEKLGPSYVKLGQFLATRPDVVGKNMARDLAGLQDRMATFPRAEAVASVEASLGRPMEELFERFGEPVAAASIAQVHEAFVTSGHLPGRVAVKIIRPGVRQ